jgi:uncharacterized Zn-binding protein involved in type VI secretion
MIEKLARAGSDVLRRLGQTHGDQPDTSGSVAPEHRQAKDRHESQTPNANFCECPKCDTVYLANQK